ncbi:MAG: primary-amine oxidase [Planctomycetaceae bacterium]|nr:primary-amine oxidase [Planctomycetaceae bacterium]
MPRGSMAGRRFLAMMAVVTGVAVGIAAISRQTTKPAARSPAATSPAMPPEAGPLHPLDPLTRAELAAVTRILREAGKLGESTRFPLVALREPAKDVVARHRPGDPIERRAVAVLYDKSANRTWEAVLNLDAGRIESWNERKGVQPPVLIEEYEQAAALVAADSRFVEAMACRGIHDTSKVQLDTWAGGGLNLPHRPGARLLRVLPYFRGEGGHAYGRPIEGVLAIVDVTAGEVVEFTDSGAFPIPGPGSDLFDPGVVGPASAALKPLRVSQPEGASFAVNGHEVQWQNWRFRYALHPREGLVLYEVGWQDGERLRPIMQRASLSEMVVPYGDANGAWNWRNAFDQGEYGLGQFASTLILGEDVPANARLMSALHASEVNGSPLLRKDTVALYEQDGGLLWRHMDYVTLKTVSRRGRQLVIHYLFTVGNYDYGLRWIFHEDGTLEAEVELTGVLLARGTSGARCSACEKLQQRETKVSGTGEDRYGTVVDPHIVAPNHQHFFCFRLDLDVDGPRNRIAELNVLSEPAGDDNPAGNAFYVELTPLRSERDSPRDNQAGSHRHWKVFQPSRRNALGHFPGYLLEPASSASPYFQPTAQIAGRAPFAAHPVWVTRWHEDELHAAGDFPSRSATEPGLPDWIADDEPLDDEDLVVWHVVGVTHVPRPEEWPIMPVARAGFRLVPAGFFTRNPSLDPATSAPPMPPNRRERRSP